MILTLAYMERVSARAGGVGVLERGTGLGTIVEEVVESIFWGLLTGVGIGAGRV